MTLILSDDVHNTIVTMTHNLKKKKKKKKKLKKKKNKKKKKLK